jgi:hypothetical protein
VRRTQFTIRGLLGATTFAAVGLYWLLNVDLSLTSNCGGNNETLADVRTILVSLELLAFGSDNGELSLQSFSAGQQRPLDEITHLSGPGGAHYFVCKAPIRLAVDDPQIIVFCDRAFTNVPRYTFRRSPPTHAVGYSDGTTKLISEREFERIDRSKFIAVDSLSASQMTAP